MGYKAKWYTDEGNLRSLGREHLHRLLHRYEKELAEDGITIAEPEDDDAYYRDLAAVFMRPDGIPAVLHEALFFISELDNDRGEERIVKAAQEGRLSVDINGDCSTADKALLAWLADDAVVRQLHIEVGLDASRSFLYLKSDPQSSLQMSDFEKARPKLEAALGAIFQKQSRKAWAEVTYHPRGEDHVFAVWRTEPFRRETRHVPTGTEPIYFWPTSQDLVIYNEDHQDLRMNVASRWQKLNYAQIFGQYLFGSPTAFFEGPKYTLQPLRDRGPDSLEASAHGISSIRLQELSCRVRENTNDFRIRRSDDVFESYASEGGLPDGEELAAAKFKVRFADSSIERVVTIQPPNRAKYMQDENGLRVTGWMRDQGFILAREPEPPATLTGTVDNDSPQNLVHVTLAVS